MMNSSVERSDPPEPATLRGALEPGLFESRKLEEPAAPLVEESVQHFIEEADKKQIDLGFDLQPAMRLRGDRFLLADLIDNLIDNAGALFAAARDGDGALPRRRGRHRAVGGRLGPGIAPEHRELIRPLLPTTRSPAAAWDWPSCGEIAHDHGGVITVDCKEEGRAPSSRCISLAA
jgi:two-component system sensor histidine kinase TctE